MKWMLDLRQIAHGGIVFGLALSVGCADPGPSGVADSAPDGSPITGLATEAAGAETYDAEVPLAWFGLSFDLTRDEGLFPPPAARAYAYAGVTLWEAVAPGVPGGRSLAGQLNGLADFPTPRHELHWPTVANAALAGIMQRFYTSPASRQAIRELEHAFQDRFRREIPGRLFGRSVAHGQRVATAIWQWSRSDGYGEFNDCAYTPPAGAGLWSPTPPGFLAPVQPCWGSLRPFVLSAATACEPGPHPLYSEDPASEFYQQALEVYETVNNATEEQRTIALYWADLDGESGTPAGHSLSITAQALEQLGASLDLAAEAFARVGIGESDAFISCWAGKYHYNVLRPVTYINDLIDPAWESILVTPPFPAYASGHSNDAGAASAILTALFGDGFAFTDHTNDERGFAPRSFGSFFEAAEESAFSRLYGGIHYRFDIENGIDQGRCVADVVNALDFRTGRP
ncbi:MAG: vanadium-dependent haloperoxidase [Gemmatimonadota bacterium]